MAPAHFSARRFLSTAFLAGLLAMVACSGVGGSSSGNSAKPSVSFSATPSRITAGASATLDWSVTNADSVTIDNGIGSVPPSGQRSVTPSSTTTYTLTAIGSGGSTSAQTTITVDRSSAPPPTVTSFKANPATISPGQSTQLSWTTTNADTVTIDNGIGSQTASGQVTVTPSATTTYTLVANGAGGQSSPATATVTVSTVTGMAHINHILFMIQENRSFDEYFGKLDDYRVKAFGLPPGAVDGI